MKNVAKCDIWCELQNFVNYRVFERKLRPRFSGRGYVCLGVTYRRFFFFGSRGRGRILVFRAFSFAVGLKLSFRRRSLRRAVVERFSDTVVCVFVVSGIFWIFGH